MRQVSITFVCLLVFPWVLQAGDPAPVITDVSVETGRVYLVINNFTYDGTGIDVRAVVSPSSTFSPYTTITDDLRKPGGYTNETLVLTIPPGTSLDYISYISIWCVPATVSFGDGQFLPP